VIHVDCAVFLGLLMVGSADACAALLGLDLVEHVAAFGGGIW
jgi:hypothetical protein